MKATPSIRVYVFCFAKSYRYNIFTAIYYHAVDDDNENKQNTTETPQKIF